MIKALFDILKLRDDSTTRRFTSWQWIGHLCPLTALFIAVIIHFMGPKEWHDWTMIGIATGFAFTTFIFWWWVVYSVAYTYQQYKEITVELRKVTKLLADTQAIILTQAEDIDAIHRFGERTEQAANESPFHKKS